MVFLSVVVGIMLVVALVVSFTIAYKSGFSNQVLAENEAATKQTLAVCCPIAVKYALVVAFIAQVYTWLA